jgi:integrase
MLVGFACWQLAVHCSDRECSSSTCTVPSVRQRLGPGLGSDPAVSDPAPLLLAPQLEQALAGRRRRLPLRASAPATRLRPGVAKGCAAAGVRIEDLPASPRPRRSRLPVQQGQPAVAQGRLRWSNPPRLEQAIGPGGDRPAIVTVLLFTGLRIAELVALDTGDLSISARKGQLPFAAARESATGRSRSTPRPEPFSIPGSPPGLGCPGRQARVVPVAEGPAAIRPGRRPRRPSPRPRRRRHAVGAHPAPHLPDRPRARRPRHRPRRRTRWPQADSRPPAGTACLATPTYKRQGQPRR